MIRALALAALLTVSACTQVTSSNASSFIDPAWNGQPISSALIEMRGGNLREQEAVERAAVAKLNEAGIRAVPSIDIFLPTCTYSAAERRRLARNANVDSVITIEPTGKTIDRTYTPPARPYGEFGWGSGGYHHTGVGVGIGIDSGLLLEEPIATYRAQLAKLSDEKVIWVGDFTTHGPTGMSFATLGARFANYLVGQLQKDGMI